LLFFGLPPPRQKKKVLPNKPFGDPPSFFVGFGGGVGGFCGGVWGGVFLGGVFFWGGFGLLVGGFCFFGGGGFLVGGGGGGGKCINFLRWFQGPTHVPSSPFSQHPLRIL